MEEAHNDGYYWVDIYDNDLIEYIPPKPTRKVIHLPDGIKKLNV